MINLKETLLGGKPLQKGTFQIFVGLHLLLAGIILLKVTHQEYWWALMVLGVGVAGRGAILVSLSGDQRTP